MTPPEGDLPQILHLAEMLMQLVGQRRLCVLSDLLEAGKLYRGMTKSKLAMLVEGLQPQVDQLAESLSLELSEERDYVQMLVDANRQMATLGEQIAGESAAAAREDQVYNDLLAHTNELSDAMRQFLKPEDTPRKTASDGAASMRRTMTTSLFAKRTAEPIRRVQRQLGACAKVAGGGEPMSRTAAGTEFAAGRAECV